jgi:hypothetical protein
MGAGVRSETATLLSNYFTRVVTASFTHEDLKRVIALRFPAVSALGVIDSVLATFDLFAGQAEGQAPAALGSR